MRNCSFDEAQTIIDNYGEREFQKIRKGFPYTEIDTEKCAVEISRLIQLPGLLSSKSHSNIVRQYHKSMFHANRVNFLSPYDYWKIASESYEEFTKLFRACLVYGEYCKNHRAAMYKGNLPLFAYVCALSTCGSAPCVSYFKPRMAKYIIEKYIPYTEIFDPFSGYSGRMLGAYSCGKTYIGADISSTIVDESRQILKLLKNTKLNIDQSNALLSSGKFQSLFTCPPYMQLEEWKDGNILISGTRSCDEWIDICLSNYQCNLYIFVVDDKIEKFKKYIVEKIENKSRWCANMEYIVKIT